MKKIILLLLFVSVGLISCKNEKKDKTQKKESELAINNKLLEESNKANQVKDIQKGNVNLKESKLLWKGSKPTGSHHGTVSLKSGNLILENNELKGGEFIIDMNTIVDLDLKAGDGKEDLEDHLKDEDFFNVKEFPTSKFLITSVEQKDDKLLVTGNLKVKNVEKSIIIPATLSMVDNIVIFKSDVFKVNRADYGIKYKSKSFFNNLKDKFINDEVEFSFEIKTKK